MAIEKPAQGSTTINAIAEIKDANGNPIVVPLVLDTTYNPPRLLIELPDRALRDLGIVDAIIKTPNGDSAMDDANDAVRVAIVSGGGTGGTASDDDDDFTAGATSGTPAMGVYENSPSSVTDGDLGIVGITETRAMKVHLVNGGSGGTASDDDSAFTAGSDSGTPMMGFATSDTVDSGDVGVLAMDTSRQLKVVEASGAAIKTAVEAIETAVEGTLTVDGSGVTQPVSHAALTELAAAIDTEVQVDVVGALPAGDNNIGNVDIASALPAGDNNIGNVDIASALPAGTNLLGRTSASLETSTIYNGTTALTPKFAVIDDASSGDNTIVTAVTSKKIRVLAAFLVSAGTATVRFESGAGGTALTGQMSLVANTGFVLPFNPVGWFETAAEALLNLELSAGVSVDGSIVYVEV